MKRILLISMLVVSLALSACGVKKEVTVQNIPKPKPIVVEKPNFTNETYPKVDGSTATIPLSEALASNILGLSKDDVKKFVKHNKTHDAYVNLIKGNADIIFVTEPSAEELKIAKDANVELEVVPVVKEGFVFLVNTNNSVNNLTIKQIQDVYQGKVTNWKDVGGSDNEIVAYQREPNSGSQTLMEQKVMKGLKMMQEPTTVINGMGELVETVASYENSEKSIGYSVYYYAKTMYLRDTIKLLNIDGIKPDNNTISSGKYPFTTAYYAVVKKSTPADSSARQLLKWMLSEGGQKVAEAAGYVPLEKR